MRRRLVSSLVALVAAACASEPPARNVPAQSPEPTASAEPAELALSATPKATAVAVASNAPQTEPPQTDEEVAKRCAEQHPKPYPVVAGEDPRAPGDPSSGTSLSAIVPNESLGGAAKTVAAMAPAFRRCFMRALVCDPDMQGSTRIAAKIDAEGRVTSATPIRAKGLSTGVLDCLVGVVSERTFDKPEGGGATIVIPVVFVSAG